MKPLILILTLSVLSLFFLLGCGVLPQSMDGAERAAVLAYSEPQTENLLTGFNSGDYAVFARDFDDTMLKAENETVFQQTRSQIMSRIGKYISRQVTSVVKQDQFIVVNYAGRFEQEDGVSMRVVFHPGGEHKITGLWFDSPKLRQQ